MHERESTEVGALNTAAGIAENPFPLEYYGSMTATLDALEAIHGDLSDHGHRLLGALAGVDLHVPNGHFTLDSRHQAGGTNLILATTWPKLGYRVVRSIPNVEPTFGGYFKRSDPPPTGSTPPCMKRTPPPWAR